MPKKPEINVNITYKIVSNEESEKILKIVKNWYVEEFIKWFNNQINNQQKIEG